ncbi:hypothetical protein Tco_0533943 [Tanacetum coccineum]
MALPPLNQRHQYLRYEGLQYTDADIADFKSRLAGIYKREIHRVQNKDWHNYGVLGRYSVSVPALTKDHEGNKINMPYPEEGNTPYSSYMEIKYSGRYQTLSLLQESPNMPFLRHWIRRIEPTLDLINRKLKNEF